MLQRSSMSTDKGVNFLSQTITSLKIIGPKKQVPGMTLMAQLIENYSAGAVTQSGF